MARTIFTILKGKGRTPYFSREELLRTSSIRDPIEAHSHEDGGAGGRAALRHCLAPKTPWGPPDMTNSKSVQITLLQMQPS